MSALAPGTEGTVVDVRSHDPLCVERLFALGVAPGAAVRVLQRFPATVFLCDQTELAVERAVADVILVSTGL
jgi:Fe2+ transport system protein FeoA